MVVSFAGAPFIGLFLESVVYGSALTLGCATVVVLSKMKSEGRTPHRQLILVLCLMLMVATPHIIISFIRAFRAIVLSPEHSFTPQDAFDPLLNVNNMLFLAQAILGDGVNIWRFYVIYNRKLKHVVVPSVMMLAGAGEWKDHLHPCGFLINAIVCACLMISSYAHLTSAEGLYNSTGSKFGQACEAFMIATNIYCTVAVAWKIHRTTQFHVSGSRARLAFIVIAETGVLYTSSLIVCLALYIAQSEGMTIALDLIPPLVPCIFCFMILQTQLNRGDNSGAAAYAIRTPRPPSPDGASSRAWIRRMLGHGSVVTTSTPRPVQIKISRVEEEHHPGQDVILVQKNGRRFFADPGEV